MILVMKRVLEAVYLHGLSYLMSWKLLSRLIPPSAVFSAIKRFSVPWLNSQQVNYLCVQAWPKLLNFEYFGWTKHLWHDGNKIMLGWLPFLRYLAQSIFELSLMVIFRSFKVRQQINSSHLMFYNFHEEPKMHSRMDKHLLCLRIQKFIVLRYIHSPHTPLPTDLGFLSFSNRKFDR